MKYILNSLIFVLYMTYVNATPLSDELVVLHNASTTEMNAITSPAQGSLIFNSDDKEIYEYNSTQWNRISSIGSETKVLSGDCIDITGVGTIANPYIATRSTPGKTQATAGLVCKQLFDTGCAMTNGMYWINPDGGSTANAFEVYCDMTTQGGGWTKIEYASDLAHINRWTSGDSRKWVPSNFTLILSDTQINDIRTVSTEGRQHYVGSCTHVIHYFYNDGSDYGDAFGFRFHNGDETVVGKQSYEPENFIVTKDECALNDSTQRESIFEINDIRIPIINVKSKDSGNSGELFGSPLTNNPAWFR